AQIIDPQCGFDLTITGIDHLEEARKEPEASLRARKLVRKPFDLSQAPLLRGELLCFDTSYYVLVLSVHHIVSDAWSVGVFLRELTILYTAYVEGREAGLAELPIQYADYASWQREWLQGEVLEKELEYWREELREMPEMMGLPSDYSRPRRQSYAGAHHEVKLSRAVTEGLKQMGRERGATLFMVLLAGFQGLLSRYSGQKDIVVGTSVANRNRTELEGLIGFFVNTLVMRVKLKRGMSCWELVKRVREVALGAYAHQELPFEKLVAELQPERDLARSPLFQVFLSLENTPQEAFALHDVRMHTIFIEPETVKFDIELFFKETPQGLRGLFTYATDLFRRETIERMGQHYVRLLEEMV